MRTGSSLTGAESIQIRPLERDVTHRPDRTDLTKDPPDVGSRGKSIVKEHSSWP